MFGSCRAVVAGKCACWCTTSVNVIDFTSHFDEFKTLIWAPRSTPHTLGARKSTRGSENVGIILTTPPIECQMLYNIWVLAPYTWHTYRHGKGSLLYLLYCRCCTCNLILWLCITDVALIISYWDICITDLAPIISYRDICITDVAPINSYWDLWITDVAPKISYSDFVSQMQLP